jgi:AcrR family transcriptional regulator
VSKLRHKYLTVDGGQVAAGDGVRVFSISELEQETGFPRTTIHYYLKLGLLPPVQMRGRGPGFYVEAHLNRLLEIRSFKEDGLTLDEMRRRLASEKDSGASHLDLPASQSRALRKLILDAATDEFAANGYRRAHLADIVAACNISTVTLYRFFPSKRDLFVNVVESKVVRVIERTEGHLRKEPDLVRRHIIRVRSWLYAGNLSGRVVTFLREEALGADEETRALAMETYRKLAEPIATDLRTLRGRGPGLLAASDELMAYLLLGGWEDSAMRVSWDGTYTLTDYLEVNLQAFLLVKAAYSGQYDVSEEYASYAPLIAELARVSST